MVHLQVTSKRQIEGALIPMMQKKNEPNPLRLKVVEPIRG